MLYRHMKLANAVGKIAPVVFNAGLQQTYNCKKEKCSMQSAIKWSTIYRSRSVLRNLNKFPKTYIIMPDCYCCSVAQSCPTRFQPHGL